ncbi:MULTISPECIES: FecR family protein [Paenibacillus]|uniref:FecR family protein n=1 Tax=Paenibacillus TaxID=44249 RepID=UPI00280B16E1|nr:FecR domain-containing protein [Paenibacillus polysaccharolyticus]
MLKRIGTLTLFLALLTFILSSLNVSAATRVIESALITTVQGEVTITRAGGLKQIPAFSNMKLYQGDRIITGNTGAVTFKVSNPESERSLGKNSNAVISKLKHNTLGNEFSIKLWTGSIWSSVSHLADSDTDYIETPGSKLRVRGTNFHVMVQSDGTLTVFVASGLVAGSTSDIHASKASFLVAPAQQISFNSVAPPKNMQDAITVADVAKLTQQADPFILKAMLFSTPAIITENTKLEKQLNDDMNKNISPLIQRDGIQADMTINNKKALSNYLDNINRLISNIASESVRLNKINNNEMNVILNTVNQQIIDIERKISLQNVKPLHAMGGINPEGFQNKETERLRLESLQKEIQKQQQVLKEEAKARLDSSLETILDNKQKIDSVNKSILDQIQGRAEKTYTAQLSPEELKTFEKNKQQLGLNHSDSDPAPVVTAPDSPGNSAGKPNTPKVTLVQTPTAKGFELSIRLKDFTGSSAIFGTEFHFISDTGVDVTNPANRFLNDSYFNPSNSVDITKTYVGNSDNGLTQKKETIYAATQFGTTSNIAISDGILATIPFSISGDGTFKLFYVKIVDHTGRTILELNDSNADLPPAFHFTK